MNYYLRPQGSSERLFISNIMPSSEPEYQFTATADLFNIKASKNVLVSVRVSSNLYEVHALCHLMLNCPKFKLQVMQILASAFWEFRESCEARRKQNVHEALGGQHKFHSQQ